MQKDGEFKEHVENLSHKANVHPFLKRYCEVGVREGLFSDTVSAIGRLHDTLVQAAYPEMIGRGIITVRPTTEAMERFPLDEKAVATVCWLAQLFLCYEAPVTRFTQVLNSKGENLTLHPIKQAGEDTAYGEGIDVKAIFCLPKRKKHCWSQATSQTIT